MRLPRMLGTAFSVALIVGLLAVALPAGAQTGTSSSSTSSSTATLNSLSMERVLVLSDVLSSLSSNLPASTLGSIASGAQEIHEQMNYNPQASTLTSTFFIVPAGSPLPTNLGTVPLSNILAIVAVTPDKTYVTSTAVQFVGLISQSSAPLLGTASYVGTPASVSFGYTSDTPPKIHDVVESVAGVGVIYTAGATGTVSITQPSSGGGSGTGTGTGVTIVVTGGNSTSAATSFQTTVNQITLNASGSTSSNAGTLTYAWSIPTGAPSAVISFPGGNMAMPFIQFVSGKQTYTVTLTVTDAKGVTATSTITIQYI